MRVGRRVSTESIRGAPTEFMRLDDDHLVHVSESMAVAAALTLSRLTPSHAAIRSGRTKL
jgi:hypothetical protein